MQGWEHKFNIQKAYLLGESAMNHEPRTGLVSSLKKDVRIPDKTKKPTLIAQLNYIGNLDK
jgi:hypothetical protein